MPKKEQREVLELMAAINKAEMVLSEMIIFTAKAQTLVQMLLKISKHEELAELYRALYMLSKDEK